MTYIAQNKKYMAQNIINYALKSNADFDFDFTKIETINLEEYYKDKIRNYLRALKYYDYGLVEVYIWKDSRKKEVDIDSYQVVNLRTNKILSEGSLEFISKDMDYYRENRLRVASLMLLRRYNILDRFII